MPGDRRLRRLVALFLAAALLLNFPMLAVVEAVASDVGPAVTTVYIFGVWALVIAAAAWLMERQGG
jgi:hypothetical protein